MKNKSVHSCRSVHHAKFHCIMTTLNKLFKIKFKRGDWKRAGFYTIGQLSSDLFGKICGQFTLNVFFSFSHIWISLLKNYLGVSPFPTFSFLSCLACYYGWMRDVTMLAMWTNVCTTVSSFTMQYFFTLWKRENKFFKTKIWKIIVVGSSKEKRNTNSFFY